MHPKCGQRLPSRSVDPSFPATNDFTAHTTDACNLRLGQAEAHSLFPESRRNSI